MPMETSEKRFEQDIETFMLSIEGGYTKTTDTYDANYFWLALIRADDSGFIQASDGVSLVDNRGYELVDNTYPHLVWDNELTVE